MNNDIKTKKTMAAKTDSLSEREQIFMKHGLKVQWVEKTGCSIVMSQKPKNK